MRIFAVLAILVTAQTVDARPPPDDYEEPTSWRDDRAFLEWSTSPASTSEHEWRQARPPSTNRDELDRAKR